MAKQTLISFHGKQEIKAAKIVALNKHKELDNLMQKDYFNASLKKGCAVTCTMYTPDDFESGNVSTSNLHGRYETELGIPRIIARLEDRIFEGLPVAESKNWPLNFINAIPVGVDLENVWRKFMIWLLIDNTEGVIKYAKNENGRKAIQAVADAYERSLVTEISWSEWNELRKTARSAYAAADAAAYAYAYAAAYAADAAAAAAAAAADAAADADAAARRLAISTARENARNRKYILMSEKLIELLKAA